MLKHAGLAVPPTLITKHADAVRDFAAAFGNLIVKPLAEPVVYESGGEALVYTRRIGHAELGSLAGVDATAHLFQQWQPKRCEVRVTAVGDQLPTTSGPGSPATWTPPDWRSARSTSSSGRTDRGGPSRLTPLADGAGWPKNAVCRSPRRSRTH